KKVVEDIMEFGDVQKGLLGVSGSNINPSLATEKGPDQLSGVYVARVEEGSGASDAGLLEGDIITKIDNLEVHKFSELTGYLSSKRPGDKVQVTVDRKGDALVKR